jgi:oxalate---CoA ligase
MFFCVHKYFYQRSEHWKDVREEESRAEATAKAKERDAHVDTNADPDADQGDTTLIDEGFAPLDGRHLSSLTIVRSRIIQLLERSENNMYVAHNLLRRLVRWSSHSFRSGN